MIWPKDKFTRFEVARILGARSLQIALGAPVLIKTEEGRALEVAKEEFKKKLIPITVKRELPDGTRMSIDSKASIENWLRKHDGNI